MAPQNQELGLGPANLPTLGISETLYSWCGHVHKLNGNVRSRTTSRQLFGHWSAGLLHDFPAYLGRLSARTGGALGATRDLALGHTMLRYFVPLRSAEHVEELIERITEGAAPYLKYELGIAASRIGAAHPLKICDECVIADEHASGFAHLHIDHQYPSVLVCPTHEIPLQYSSNRQTPVHRRDWMLPRSTLAAWAPLSIDERRQRGLSRLAHLSLQYADLGPGALDPTRLREVYLAALDKGGYLTQQGSLRTRSVNSDLLEHYSALSSIPGPLMPMRDSATWLGLIPMLTRAMPRTGHPFKHLLLIGFLFDTWNAFVEAYRSSTPTKDGVATPPQPLTRERHVRRETFISLVATKTLSITAASKQVGITPTTGVRWAKIAGITFRSRAKTLTPEILGAVRGELRSGRSKQEVARSTGITQVSLDRLLSSEPSVAAAWRTARTAAARNLNRRNFLAVVRANPGKSIKLLRQVPGNGYQWLYRHDRDWLARHMPALWR